ncbi:AMP-binding protein [Bradyrhizobium sp. 14AA]
MGTLLDRAAAEFGDNIALASTSQNSRWTYKELAAKADLFAKGLIAMGLQPGDRIGLWSPNCAEWAVVQFAAGKAGLILVNLNPAYRARELQYALNKVDCKALVMAVGTKSTNFFDILSEIAPELRTSEPLHLSSSLVPKLKAVVHLGSHGEPGALNYQDVISLGARQHNNALLEVSAGLKASDPINIQFTSGTTGLPKAAVLSHSSLINIAIATAKRCETSSQSAICLPLPLYHVFAMALGPVLATYCGAKLVLTGAAFDEVAVLESIERERCTTLYAVPTMFAALVKHPRKSDFDLSSLDTAIAGGASMPPQLMQSVIRELGIPRAHVGYGMTEVSSSILMGSPNDPEEKRMTTVGRPVANIEVKVVDPAGSITKIGEPGELHVRGVGIMLGYWSDDKSTRETIDKDGWLRTGDIAILDAQGFGMIVGRIKEMVIRGGENISPREIEEFLLPHPKIDMVYVVGVPDEKYGEELCACIKPKAGMTCDAEDLRLFCDGRLSHYKIPKYVRNVEAFPLTPTGKVQKFVLAKESADSLGLEHPG